VERKVQNSLDDGAEETGKVLSFERHLSRESGAALEKQVLALIRDIEQQGATLCRRADMGEMQKYRGMITQLINETVSNGYAFSKEEKFGGNGRGRVFAVIRRVNEKLDAMTQKILKKEEKNLDLLDDVDDIRGLLVDLYF
jgi:uncharacterized protein YaaR (DUF327 family)